MINIKLLGRFGFGLHANTDHVLQCAEDILKAKEKDEIYLDFSDVEFLYPSGLNILIVLGKYLANTRNCRILQNEPKDPEVKNFLLESGFSHEVGVKLETNGRVPPHDESYIYKIRNFTDIDDYEIERLIDVIEKELKLSDYVRQNLHENLAELILNVNQHSQSPEGCYIIGQGYENTHRIRFCIGDMGIGIRQHLGNKYTDLLTKDSTEAIEMALQEGITGTLHNQNAGVGLSYFRRFVEVCNGSFIIISDNGFYMEEKIKGTKTKPVKKSLNFKFPGTLIDVTILSQRGMKLFHKSEPIPKEYRLIK